MKTRTKMNLMMVLTVPPLSVGSQGSHNSHGSQSSHFKRDAPGGPLTPQPTTMPNKQELVFAAGTADILSKSFIKAYKDSAEEEKKLKKKEAEDEEEVKRPKISDSIEIFACTEKNRADECSLISEFKLAKVSYDCYDKHLALRVKVFGETLTLYLPTNSRMLTTAQEKSDICQRFKRLL